MALQDVWRNSRLAGHSREIGLVSGGLASLVVGSLALGSFALKVNSVMPAPASIIAPDTTVDVRFFGLPYGGRVVVDGQEVESQLSLTHQSLQCVLKGLPEGNHRMEVELFSPLKTAREVSDFVVDSTPPVLSVQGLANPALVGQAHLSIHGKTEEQATVYLLRATSEKDTEPKQLEQLPADPKGHFMLEADLAPGWNDFIIRAKDPAGNFTQKRQRIFRDTQAPEARLERVNPEGGGEPVNLDGHTAERYKIRVRLVAHDDSGRLFGATWSQDSSTPRPCALKRILPDKGGLQTEYRSEWILDNLPEGESKISCTVIDKVGRKQTVTATVTVDSSEKLGERPMVHGARGADVEQLQERLMEMKYLAQGEPTSVYDDATEEAVRAYQTAQGYEATGNLTGSTLASLGPRIFINLSRFSLVLDRPGHELIRYGVATGQPKYPTPPGRFKIVYKEKNPTWMPPNSAWAKEAKSVPPGPKNPLGTRWIGLDSNSVGIHGTNADWSIGSAASHGCLRMHIADVEALYEMVEPGIPVTIYTGNENNEDIRKYWP